MPNILKSPLNYLRTHPLVFISVLLSLLVVVGIIIRLITPAVPAPPATQVGFRGLYPGFSSPEDVIATLGQPLETTDWENQTILNYDVADTAWNDQIFTQDNQVVLIRELVLSTAGNQKSAFLAQYGQPETIFYGPLSTAGQHLYAYPSRGIAFLAPEFADALAEIWYFAPTDATQFLEIIQPHGYGTVKPESVE